MLKQMIYKIYKKFGRKIINVCFSEENQVIYRYKKIYGQIPNLKNPVKFSEKIQVRKLKENNSLFYICSDKIKVKEYVEKKIGKEYVIPTYQIAREWAELDFNKFPKKFVIKTNHDSGTVFVIHNKEKEKEKINNIEEKINKALKIDYGKLSGEKFYSKIPRKILVEEFLETIDGKVPPDYKFHMFKQKNGSFKSIIQVDLDRFEEHKRGFFTEKWVQLPYITASTHKLIDFKYKKPKSIDKMLKLAEKLAEDFTYVRVDFYDTGEKIYLGELTFAHGSGFEKFTLPEGDIEFGNYWECFKL